MDCMVRGLMHLSKLMMDLRVLERKYILEKLKKAIKKTKKLKKP